MIKRVGLMIVAVATMWSGVAGASLPEEHNVVVVAIDGLRWQEVFQGMQEDHVRGKSSGLREREQPAVLAEYGGATAEIRREKLMPFFWSQVAKHGTVWGNRAIGSTMQVQNTALVSYPGYNEMLTGKVDPVLMTNFPLPNPNVTVLEWLDQQPGTAGRVVACVNWQVFPAIFNVGRSKFPLWVTGHQRSRLDQWSPKMKEIQQWIDDITPLSPEEHFDGFVYRAALDLIDTHQPRVMFISFGEVDFNAHAKRYAGYLGTVRQSDRYIRELWDALQSRPQYRDRTTLILTTDHGRGVSPTNWTDHGTKTPGSAEMWLAAMGPGVAARGEVAGGEAVVLGQVAATIATLVGHDYRAAVPAAAEGLDLTAK